VYGDRQRGKKPPGSQALHHRRVAIRAVVFDVGSVLEVIDDRVFPGTWPGRLGLKKPDPAIYALAERRLGVEPAEVLFLDDVTVNVEAALAAGWHAVLHESTPGSIAELERIIAAGGS
jgi:beta-phosphoglucomutase-like phosphatase (HAD superfamily)